MKKFIIFIFTLLLIGPFSIQAAEKPEFEVTVYDGINFTGQSYTIRNEIPDLSVNEYYETSYKPNIFPSLTGKYISQRTSFNDRTSSVKYSISPGYTVTLYSSNNYGGANVTLSGQGEIADLSSRGFDNVMSSIELNQVIPNMPEIILYNDGNGCYCQGSVIVDENVRNLEKYKFNDKTSALKIVNPINGYPIIISFYNAANYEGFAYSVKLAPGEKLDVPQLDPVHNESISSIKIEKYNETVDVTFIDNGGMRMNSFQGYVSEFRKFEYNDRPVRVEAYNESNTMSYKLNYYDTENYQGVSAGTVIYPTERFVGPVPTELLGKVSSSVVTPYTSPEIVLYENYNLTGNSYPFVGDISDFQEFNRKTNSVYMHNPSFTTFEVTFYNGKNYQNPLETKTIYPMETVIFNPTASNAISSVKSVPAEGPVITIIDEGKEIVKIPQGNVKDLNRFSDKAELVNVYNPTNNIYELHFYEGDWNSREIMAPIEIHPNTSIKVHFAPFDRNALSSIKVIER